MARRRRHPKQVEPLIEALRDPDRGFAAHDEAVRALSRLGAEAVGPLIGLLYDPDSRVRGRAAATLGLIKRPAVTALIEVLQGDDPEAQPSPDARPWAALALGMARSTRATQPLIQALQDDHADLRRKAAVALGWLNDPRAIEPLAAALHDPDADVRRCAVEALGRIGEPEVIEPLRAALNDADESVRDAARAALDRLEAA